LVLTLVGRAPAQEADVLLRSPDMSMPVMDGVVDDVWSVSTEQEITITIAGSEPSGLADCSGAWRALWDWEYLYMLVEVKDEMLRHDSTYNRSWEDDSVEVYVDGDNSKRISVDENDHQYCFRWYTQVETPRAQHHGEPSLEGVEYAVDTTGSGYLFEIRLPWVSMMSKQPTAGQLIGIDVFINDDDDGGSRDTQISWYATDGTGWNTPSMWGTALLVADKRAVNPEPKAGAMHPETWANLSWMPGPTAVSHDVYFGDNFNDVSDGTGDTFQGNQTATSFTAGLPGFPYPDGLLMDTTYYWRIDEIEADGTTIHKGDVWSFTVSSMNTGEDFESNNFSTFPWEHRGNASWTITSHEKHSGTYSAQAGAIEHDERTTLRVRVDCISGDITFYHKVSSEVDCDYLKFYIDGEEKGEWSGTTDWDQVSFTVRAGTRTFDWTYSKDGSISSDWDTAWIDDIVFPIGADTIPTGQVIELTDGTFDQTVLRSDVPVLVDFWAPWCGPCLVMAPVIEEITDEYAGKVKVCRLNVDNAHQTTTNYGIRYIPTFILFKDGQVQRQWVGVTSKNELTAAIDELLYPSPPTNIIDLTDATFDQTVLRSGLPVLVDFWAPWCGPCLTMAPVIQEIADEYAGRAKTCKLNVDNAPQTTTNYGIRYIPTFILFKDGRVQKQWVGVTSKNELTAAIDELVDSLSPDSLSGALDTALNFTTGGSADWFAQTTTSRYGQDAAQSPDISHNQDSWMQTTVSGKGTVKFYWKVSSEEDFDFLEFYIDGSLQDNISGSDGDWELQTYTISTSGSHTLEWRYVKDGSGDSGSDCGWVDKVEWVTTP